MKSILFGSIGSVVESSEIQRQAFNEAFKEFGVDWYWNVGNYIKMLQKPGGLNRLVEYSKNELNSDDAKLIYLLKIKHFKLLSENNLKPRDGVLDVIQYALKHNIKIAFITTTTKDTLDIVINNLSKYIDFSKFDLITHDEFVTNRKPDPEIYKFALNYLGSTQSSSIAIENTLENCNSSINAKIQTLLYPGEYTIYGENSLISRDILKSVKSFFEES